MSFDLNCKQIQFYKKAKTIYEIHSPFLFPFLMDVYFCKKYKNIDAELKAIQHYYKGISFIDDSFHGREDRFPCIFLKPYQTDRNFHFWEEIKTYDEVQLTLDLYKYAVIWGKEYQGRKMHIKFLKKAVFKPWTYIHAI